MSEAAVRTLRGKVHSHFLLRVRLLGRRLTRKLLVRGPSRCTWLEFVVIILLGALARRVVGRKLTSRGRTNRRICRLSRNLIFIHHESSSVSAYARRRL